MNTTFDKIIDRTNTECIKWDYNKENFGRDDILPMWIADMDFLSPSPVIDAIRKRAEHGIYGYTGRSASYYQSIINWMYKRHGWKIEKEWICHSPGVVTALNIAILSYTHPDDKILIQPPVYPPFFKSVQANHRQLETNPLKFADNEYVIDFVDLERKFANGIKLMILCNPHNPVGRVWTRDELTKISELCIKYNVILISDEIHSDIIYEGYKHTPVASIDSKMLKQSITCIAPSKTFNIAGLSTSAIIIPDKDLRYKFNDTLNRIGISGGNIFGITALETAYTYGEDWLNDLIVYLQQNINFLNNYLEQHLPKIKAVIPQGTYLVWLDFRELGLNHDELNDFLINNAKVGLNDGTMFGESGSGFQRMNIACPRAILLEGLNRIKKASQEL
jgi:cystathionine beta-lyase